MSQLGSISKLLTDLKQGDEEAAQALWNRTVRTVAAAARRHILSLGVRGVDEEDIAIDVFAGLCHGVAEARYPRLENRKDLWQVLLMLTRHRVIDQHRRRAPDHTESALPRTETDDSQLPGVSLLAGDDLRPEVITIAVEELDRLLASLDPERRKIALLRMDGHTHREIAQHLGTSLRSIERKIPLIHKKWAEQCLD